jgi:EpsI family protein
MRNKYTVALTAVLLLQAGAYYAAELRSEKPAIAAPLQYFPPVIGNWAAVRDTPMDKETLELLKADDTLNRDYLRADGAAGANFFMAYFKTQRTGQSPHSPKNCLPGAGWEASATGHILVDVPSLHRPPIEINRYIVSRGEQKSVVLYWYQSHGRVIASEFSAKFWLVADAVRYHRSDTALVRVVVPVFRNDDATAQAIAVGFVQSVFPAVNAQMPL